MSVQQEIFELAMAYGKAIQRWRDSGEDSPEKDQLYQEARNREEALADAAALLDGTEVIDPSGPMVTYSVNYIARYQTTVTLPASLNMNELAQSGALFRPGKLPASMRIELPISELSTLRPTWAEVDFWDVLDEPEKEKKVIQRKARKPTKRKQTKK